MKRLLAFIVLLPACVDADNHTGLAAVDVQSLVTAIDSVSVQRVVRVSYVTCPKNVDVNVAATIEYPLELRYAIDLGAASTSVTGNVLTVTPGTAIGRSFDSMKILTDDPDESVTLNLAGMRKVSDQVFADLPAVAEYYSAQQLDESVIAELIEKARGVVVTAVSAEVEDDFTVSIGADFDAVTPPALPELDLCEGESISVSASETALSVPTKLGRNIIPVTGSDISEQVFEYLVDSNGKRIAYRARTGTTNVPSGRVSIESLDTDVELQNGRMNARIVGGEKVPDGMMPFAVAFASKGLDETFLNYCGGTLIDANWVATAAHCPVTDLSYAIIGRNTINGTGGKVHEVKSAWRHIDFDKSSGVMYDNDIALVELKESAEEEPAATIDSSIPNGRDVTAVGWGARVSGGDPVERLYWVGLKIVPHGTCKFAYRTRPTKVSEMMICASEPGSDTCQGDSGGGLFREEPIGTWKLAGIVSFGEGCAEPEFPGVYTDITDYNQWIDDVRNAVQNQ